MIYDKFEKLNDGKHDRAIKALVGMSLSKFDMLAAAFAAAYPAIRQERFEKGEIKQIQADLADEAQAVVGQHPQVQHEVVAVELGRRAGTPGRGRT